MPASSAPSTGSPLKTPDSWCGVANERRLVALYLLTHADVRGTSPQVWNGWKGKLLEDLFFATQRLLRGATPQEALGLDGRLEDARRQLRFHGLRPGVEDEL